MHPERRIFLGQLAQRDAHLFLVSLGLGLDGNGNHRIRKLHALERDHRVQIAQRVAGRHVLQAHGRGDVTGAHFLDLLAGVGVHLQDAPDPLFLALDRVVSGVAGLQHARVDPEERQGADIGVGRDLERQRSERLFVGALAHALGLVFVDAANGRHVQRRRHQQHHGVQQGLHTLVLEGGAAEAGHEFVGQRSGTQTGDDLLLVQGPFLEIGLHQLFRRFGGRFDHELVGCRGSFLEFGRNVAGLVGRTHVLDIPVDRLHANQVDDAFEMFFCADRQLDRHRRVRPGVP